MVPDKPRASVRTPPGRRASTGDSAGSAATMANPAVPDYATLFESMPAAAFLIDVGSGRIVHGNQAAVDLCGLSRGQLIGRKAARLFPRSELGRFWEALGPAEGRPGEFIGWIQTRSGSEVPISIVARLLPAGSEDGRICVLLAFDITELRLSLDSLSERNRVDALTGLLTRDEFGRELDARLAAPVPGRTLAVLYVELDELRRINDGYGHAQGDAVLAAFAQRLQSALPATAVLARWGNDAFVAALDELPPALLDARRELSRLAESVLEAARSPYLIGGDSVVASCSIGIGLSPHDAGDRDGLQRCADLALQQSRRSRRDSFRFFIEGDMRRLDEEIRIEAIVREAIRAESIEHAWLPMFRLQDEACVGIESLLRAGPALQSLDTARIVAVAEARALLPELGRLCLRHNFSAWAELAASGRAPAIQHLCLNLTTQELLTPGFVEELAAAAGAARVPPGRLVVEIAERDLFTSLERMRQPLDQLVQQQVRIAIDGFGSGFSSLAMLRDLPIDMVKIDRGFVWQLEASQRDREIVRAMIQLAHSLGVRAAAVGVETRAQLQALRAMGCDFAQGYLFSRPLALAELSRFLRPHAARQR